MGQGENVVIRNDPFGQVYSVERLLYLDPDFVSAAYEEITGESPATQLTRAEGGKAGISASFISAGVHTQTTLTFNISPRQMLLKIAEELQERYALFDPATYANYEGTRLAGSKADSPLGNGGPKKRT